MTSPRSGSGLVRFTFSPAFMSGVLALLTATYGGSSHAGENPSLQCQNAPFVEEETELTSFDHLPASMRAALNIRFKRWDDRNSASDPEMSQASEQELRVERKRRFVSGGHSDQRWYVLYEYVSSQERTFHMVVADVDAASQDANLISHIVGVVRDFEDLCDLASTFMNNPASTGPGLDDNLFW